MKILKKIWEWLRITVSGIVMVVTDTIPGLSGSVFLAAANLLHPVWTKWEDILKPKRKIDRWLAIAFYAAFGVGTTVGMLGFAQVIQICLEKIPTITFWFFFTAALGGVLIYFKSNKISLVSKQKNKTKTGIIFAAGFSIILIIILTTILIHGSQFLVGDIKPTSDKDGKHIIHWSQTTKIVLIMLAGFFSAYAMFTPGMSGGLIVLMFGVFGDVFGSLLADPIGNLWVLTVYGICVLAGIITAIFTLDKMFKKFPYIVNWLLMGFVSGSTLAIPVLFNVFIPSETIRWVYISLAVLSAGSLITLTVKLMSPEVIKSLK